MNNYVTGAVIKKLREKKKMTQLQLAEQLCVSDKTISKWETCKGFPDISLLEPLAKALHISVPELLAGEQIINTNQAANILRSSIYVCPICGNILHTAGNAMVSCCGITLPPLEAEETDEAHDVQYKIIEHELYITSAHEMTKQHHLSFIAYATANRFEMVKLYPEGNAEARFLSRGRGMLYWYCNHHGLFRRRV
ncbi:MAG: helix-turn-helix domain-containing protein [Eubacteriales bacterium]|nr:helix-turn-helix domain-containing protein [Eubacteriales bacterium]